MLKRENEARRAESPVDYSNTENGIAPMKLRTKLFIGALILAGGIGAVVGKDPRILIMVLLPFSLIWGLFRLFAFFHDVTRPVRKVVRPVTDKVDDHLSASLRRSGFGLVADLGGKLKTARTRLEAEAEKELSKPR